MMSCEETGSDSDDDGNDDVMTAFEYSSPASASADNAATLVRL